MNASAITELVGVPATDARVENLLRELGIARMPKLARGEFDAHAEAKKQGISLVFKDEAYLKRLDEPLGKRPLVLVGAHFYSRGHEGFSQFEGSLPNTITFSDNPSSLRAKLGEPEWRKEHMGVVIRERWDLGPHKVSITYQRDNKSVLVVYAGLV